jgi:predicted DCC family thiol-disulfide oxidoreductase YuxK
MAELHVLDARGRIHRGAYAFAVLWRELPYYRYLARLLAFLRLLPLLDWGYRHFARWRLRRRCPDGACATDNKQGR